MLLAKSSFFPVCGAVLASQQVPPLDLGVCIRTVLWLEDGDIFTLMGWFGLVKGDSEGLGSCFSSVWEGTGCIHNPAEAGTLFFPQGRAGGCGGVPLFV